MLNLTRPLCDPSHTFLPTPAQVRTSRAIAYLLKCDNDVVVTRPMNSNYATRQYQS